MLITRDDFSRKSDSAVNTARSRSEEASARVLFAREPLSRGMIGRARCNAREHREMAGVWTRKGERHVKYMSREG